MGHLIDSDEAYEREEHKYDEARSDRAEEGITEPFTWVFTDVNGEAKEIAGDPVHRSPQDLRIYTPLYKYPAVADFDMQRRHETEDLQALHQNLDNAGVPRYENDVELSAWGRALRMNQEDYEMTFVLMTTTGEYLQQGLSSGVRREEIRVVQDLNQATLFKARPESREFNERDRAFIMHAIEVKAEKISYVRLLS